MSGDVGSAARYSRSKGSAVEGEGGRRDKMGAASSPLADARAGKSALSPRGIRWRISVSASSVSYELA